MSGNEPINTINVSVAMGDVKVQFNGSAEDVILAVINFLSKQVPAFDLAKRISLNFGVGDMIETYSDLVKITPEGPRVIPDAQTRLADKDLIALQLVASRIAKDLGKAPDDAMHVSDIQLSTSLNPKSVSSRISELVKAGFAARDQTEPSKYRITTTGINWLNTAVSKKKKHDTSKKVHYLSK